jgi:transposase
MRRRNHQNIPTGVRGTRLSQKEEEVAPRGGTIMEETKLYGARVQVVEAMEQGLPWHEAAKRAGLQISQSTAYRLRQSMRQGGKSALREGRHGHPAKLRGEVRKFLEQTCRQAPSTPSHEIQTQLAQRFSLTVSVSQINRVRATLGVSNPPQSAKKK